MGWTYGARDRKSNTREWFTEEFSWSNERQTVKVLDVAPIGSTVYMALETRPTSDPALFPREVFALVVLTSWNKRDPAFNFGWKDISEDMGPYQCNCPKRILDLLTPTDNEWANEWRNKCREKLAERKSRASRPLKDGDVIRLAAPIKFSSGREVQVFEIVKEGRRMRVYEYNLEHGFRYTYTRYRVGATAFNRVGYEVVGRAPRSTSA